MLNKTLDAKDIVENACQKGRGSFMAVVGFGAREDALNPLTAAKVYKQVVLPSTLYGAELWCNLTASQTLDLERTQRFCLKVAQGLRQTTRSDMCHSLLGMPRLSAFRDKCVLLFLQRLCSLPEHAVSRRVFKYRLNQMPQPRTGSVVGHMSSLLDRYGLSEVMDCFKEDGLFPSKGGWKATVIDALVTAEREAYNQRVLYDSDFVRFQRVHPDCFAPCVSWAAAKEVPNSLSLFHFVVNLTVKTVAAVDDEHDVILCEYCGILFTDSLLHRVTMCSKFNDVREQFWCFITENFPIELPRHLHSLMDEDLVCVLLGAPLVCPELDISDNELYIFLYRCAVFLYLLN